MLCYVTLRYVIRILEPQNRSILRTDSTDYI